jgi:hypothetical protein
MDHACTLVWFLRRRELHFKKINLLCALTHDDIELSLFRQGTWTDLKRKRTLSHTVFSSATVHCFIPLKDCNRNGQIIYSKDVRVGFPLVSMCGVKGELMRIYFVLIPRWTWQEDISQWNSRLRTAQVSVSYFDNILIYRLCLLMLLQCLALSHDREKRPSFFCCVLFCLFQVPLISCASPWRAGETRNGASPKYCHCYVAEFSV